MPPSLLFRFLFFGHNAIAELRLPLLFITIENVYKLAFRIKLGEKIHNHRPHWRYYDLDKSYLRLAYPDIGIHMGPHCGWFKAIFDFAIVLVSKLL